VIVIACGFFIYGIITNSEKLKFHDFQSVLIDFNVFSAKNISLLFVFTFFNWFLEISKWQILIKKVNSASWFDAAKQSLSSLTFSLITPNRIGEYGAKALYFKRERRKEILLLNFVGNFYQLLVTILLGIIGIIYLVNYFSFVTIQNATILFLGLILLLFVIRFLEKKSAVIRHWISKIYEALKLKNNKSIFIISFLRYLVFSHQFYFLLLIFNIDIPYWNAIAGITSMYLIASIIPMLSLFDFVVKGSIAVFVFSFFEINPAIILSVTTLMWVYNFAFPAILGSYFVLTFKPVKP
jgi:hypothetical protein